MAVRSAVVQIVIQAKNATKAVFTGLKNQLASFRSAVGSMFSGLAGGIAGFVSGAAISRLLTDITEKAAAAERSQLRLAGVLKATGNAAGLTADQLAEMATEMQRTRLVDDEQVKDAMSILASFRRVSGETFTEAIRLAQDMSAVMGTDLNSSILQVGKALNDPILGVTALRRVGVQLTASQEALVKQMVETNNIAGAQQIILKELASEFGGAGEAEAKGLAGSIHRAKVAYDEFLESLGRSPEFSERMAGFFRAWESFWQARELADPLGVLQVDLDRVETRIERLKRALDPESTRPLTVKQRQAAEEQLRLLEAGANGLREEIRLLNEKSRAAEEAAKADADRAKAEQDKADADARRGEQAKAAAKALAEHNALVLEAIQYGSTHVEALLELTSEERRLTAELDRGNLSLAERVALEQRLADIRAATGIDSTPTLAPGIQETVPYRLGGAFDAMNNALLGEGQSAADEAAKAAAQMQKLTDMATIFAQSWGAAWQAFGEGSISAGEAMLQSMRGALAGIAMSEAQLALLQGAKQLALGIGAFGTPAAAKHFASAAKLFAVGAGLSALGGLLGGGGGGARGGGGSGSSASTARDSEDYRRRNDSVGIIVIQGGLLDMNDARQAEAFENAVNRLGRQGRIEIQGG